MTSPYRTHPDLTQAQTIPFPVKPAPRQPNKLELLLTLEDEVRKQQRPTALALFLVNETQRLLDCGQGLFFRSTRRGRFRLEAASSLPGIVRDSPFTHGIEAVLAKTPNLGSCAGFRLPAGAAGEDYPFDHALWLPLKDRRGKVFAGLLLARGTGWSDSDRLIGERLAGTYGHAFRALTPPSRLRSFAPPRWLLAAVPLLAAALMFIPVPLTTLAPFEVIADDPAVVTAPFDGVIDAVTADPNSTVAKGALLFSFEATELKAKADVALKRELVAQAKLDTGRQSAFANTDAKRDLAVAAKEYDLAKAERQYADDLLARVDVRAGQGGLLIYANRNELTGRPVSTGERVMEIADPATVVYRIDLPLDDAIAIDPGAKVRLFLEADPLDARGAVVREAGYRAAEVAGGGLAYRIIAAPDDKVQPARIGLRGTARIAGKTVSLGFFLFRRPLSKLRQYLGY